MSDHAGPAPGELTQKRLDAIRERLNGITPGPWFYNSYSCIFDQARSDVWGTDADTSPNYPSGKRPGPPFFTEADNAWLAQRDAAYEADPIVASVPAHYGDTATGRRAADAEFIAEARQDIPALLADRDALAARLAALAPLVEAAVEFAEAHTEYVEAGWHACGPERRNDATEALVAACRAYAARQQEWRGNDDPA